ncbi:mycothiol synthase [Allokutzneria sp. A3M-2-11 16]|uniref:mycothiol synthase n=1 Tax=Allokutzneria sp. A3M-2-11 16 TaxID=2962043 RepID=UPI0020B6C4D1|nr:mycothiol synthase [Allokutzneria sp. A3M-2-11 16]MCP3799139.1 mycothiol synthase [Allokutzneria sp. A3M-2-11 16]
MELIWQERLSGEQSDQVRALAAAAAEVDGRAPIGEHVLLNLDGGDHLVAVERDGGPVIGYAFLDRAVDNDGNTVAELAVHPEHRRRGTGSALLDGVLAKVPDRAKLRIWAHGETPAARHLAEKFGLRRARELRRMRRSLAEPLPTRATPEGVVLRTFRPGEDEAAMVAVNNRAFSWHPEQGGWTEADVRTREAKKWFDANGFFLAERDGEVVGFHWTKVHPASPSTGGEPIGEVYVVGIDPDAQGGGLGSVLLLAGLHHLRSLGLPAVMLYVEAVNTAAIRVYEKLGFDKWDADVQFAAG